MNKRGYIALDIESGGVPFDVVSLLTLYIGFFDENLNFVDELDLKLKEDIYRITVQGMEINKIDLIEHDKTAIIYREAGTLVYNFLRECKGECEEKLIPVGHNVAGDIRAIKKNLISEGSWDNFVSYRVCDTCSIAQFLRLCGKLPETLSCSTESLAEYFKTNLNVVGNLHEAKYDSLLAIENLKKLKELIK